MGEVRAGGDEHVDVAIPNQVDDDLAHPGGHHRAREADEGRHLGVEHLGIDVDRLRERVRADARLAVLGREFADGHPARDRRVFDGVVVELLARRVVRVVVAHGPDRDGVGFNRAVRGRGRTKIHMDSTSSHRG